MRLQWFKLNKNGFYVDYQTFGLNVHKLTIYLIRNRSLTSRELFSSRDDFVPDIFYREFRISNTTSVNKSV